LDEAAQGSSFVNQRDLRRTYTEVRMTKLRAIKEGQWFWRQTGKSESKATRLTLTTDRLEIE
jgi:hypothetical protein